MTATAHRGPADTGNQRRCPVCATSFLPHPRKPSQAYCTERCRAAAWRQRGRARCATPTITHDAHEVQNPVADGDTRNGEVSFVAHEESTRPGETTAVQRCPHCRQPIALLPEHDYRVNQLALQHLIAWHRDTHGPDCPCVRQVGSAAEGMLTELSRDL